MVAFNRSKGSDPLDKECNVIHHPLNYEIPNNRDDIYQIILVQF